MELMKAKLFARTRGPATPPRIPPASIHIPPL
jgi:hypothetical protein